MNGAQGQHDQHESAPAAPARKSAGLAKMVVVAIGAFALTFALVPLYRIACEKVFGIRLERTAAEGVQDAHAAPAKRVITVQFDGGVNSKLPWEFSPNQVPMQVVPGELYDNTYPARNTSQRTVVGSAVPSVAPVASRTSASSASRSATAASRASPNGFDSRGAQ